MSTVQTYPWDTAEHLATKEDIAAYLEAALEDGDPSLIAAALGDISRSRGMTHIIHQTGLERENLDKSLLNKDNPDFVTVFKFFRWLDCVFRLCLLPNASLHISMKEFWKK